MTEVQEVKNNVLNYMINGSFKWLNELLINEDNKLKILDYLTLITYFVDSFEISNENNEFYTNKELENFLINSILNRKINNYENLEQEYKKIRMKYKK